MVGVGEASPDVVVNSKNECTHVFGAGSKRSFVFLFSKRKNQRAFVRFLVKLGCVGVGFVCLSIMGRVIMGRYLMVFWFRIQRRLGFSIFQSIRRSLIQWSRAGSLRAEAFK